MNCESLPETTWRCSNMIGVDNIAYGSMKNIVFALFGQRKGLSMSKLWIITKAELAEARYGTRTYT
jgi:hypothetical protein